MSKLSADFYQREDVLSIGRELLGKVLYTQFDGSLTSGIIVETEAYAGETDRASHAYMGRRTRRTEVMYAAGGTTYIYLCYGIHHLFNVVTNRKGIPHAILIRGIEPLEGIDIMLKRRNMKKLLPRLTAGPGILSQALGISIHNSGISLLDNQIWIEDSSNNGPIGDFKIISSPRVGCEYAEEDANSPWRFRINGNPWVSPAP